MLHPALARAFFIGKQLEVREVGRSYVENMRMEGRWMVGGGSEAARKD